MWLSFIFKPHLGRISTLQTILPKGIKMQFKALAFLLILSILLFTGCHKKDKSKEQVKEEEKKEAVIEKTEKKSEFQLKAIDNTIIDVKIEDGKIIKICK